MTKSLSNPNYQQLCKYLIQAREEKSLTQVEVAQRLNKPQSYVSKYERGERRLDILEFIDLAEALGIPPDTFFNNFWNDQF